MNIFVYISEECKKDYKEHSIQKEVNQFKKRILKTQRTTYFDNFPPPYLKKRFKRQLRLIASERKIGNDIVIIFCKILVRGSSDYSNFLSAPKEYGDSNFLNIVKDSKLEEWLTEIKKQKTAPEKKELTPKEYEFLYSQVGNEGNFGGDYFIYESYDWVKSIQNNEIKNRLILIPDIILNIISDNNDASSNIKNLDSQYDIIYKIYPDNKTLLLSDICKTNRYDNDSIKKLRSIENIQIANRISRKSYPELILTDNDVWIDIENNNESNLALSPEETELLRSVHKDGKNTGFPLFINGRAGSGKSTILQYLFADYLKSYSETCSEHINPPIYLTYSDSLVEKSKNIVSSLLKHNYNNTYDVDEFNADICKQTIKVFKHFLLNNINESDRYLFVDDNYIDYSVFKKLWYDNFSQDPNALKKYNPDISWHIIRSYIKGISIDGYLEKEEYNELPREEKTVTLETFNLVYEKVWISWYKDICESNYWDNQDLVRYLLESDNIRPQYPAIFCDEAQDFTRIELELLLRLNLFTERKIDSNTLKKIPFVFAGDPFQTLNPTGFRWEAIKSTYVEKFIHSLAPELRYGTPELNYQELTFNYRSSENIVKLCNSVQLLRMSLFDYPNLKPQEIWHLEENPPLPVFFKINSPGIKAKITEQSDLCIIVPCNEGEEVDFVEQDDFLNEIIFKDDYGIPQNVFSPMRAKGLEFTRVLLYGFGRYMGDKLPLAANDITYFKQIDTDEKITLEYLVNQIYVALSRGQRRLFIVDDSSSFDSFWQFANDAGYQEELLKHCKNSKLWESKIGNLTQGTEQSWTKDKEDPIVRAKQFEEEGKSKRDSYFLRQAALSYKSAGNNEKDAACRALALEYEKKYDESGKLYIRANNYEQALSVFWKGEHYKELEKLTQSSDGSFLVPRLESRIASKILSPQLSSIDNLLFDIRDQLSQSDTDTNYWRSGIDKIFRKFMNASEISDHISYESLLKHSKEFDGIISIQPDITAELAYQAGNFQESITYYEAAGLTNTPKYKEAKLNILLSNYENKVKISPSDTQVLATHFIDQKKFKSAIELFSVHNMSSRIFELINSGSIKDEEIIILGFEKYIIALANNNGWSKLIDIFLKRSPFKGKIASKFNENKDYFTFLFVKEIASSVLLPESDTSIKEQVSDFLKEKFISNKISIWRNSYHPILIGAALERAGRDIDCLKFYENILRSREFDHNIKNLVKIRWVKVKIKQYQREEKNGLTKKAADHKIEAQKKLDDIDINIDAEPLYPSVSGYLNIKYHERKDIVTQKFNEHKTSNITDPPIKVGIINITVNRKNQRINIENIDNSYQASISLPNQTCKSVDFDFIKDGDSFYGEEIGINVSFDKNRNLNIELIQYGIQIMIEAR